MTRPIEVIQAKAKSKMEINLWLLGIVFTLFTLIITINPDLIRQNNFLSLQLVLAIPLLCSSIFARSKLGHSQKVNLWETYGYLTYILAYSFLINVVGIFLSVLVNLQIGLVFWIGNILSALIYSLLEIIGDKEKIGSRIPKDLIFIIIIIMFGILPVIV